MVSRISLIFDSTFFYYEMLSCVSDWQLLTVLHRLTQTVSALKSYQSDTLSSQFPLFHLSSWWSQWRPKPGAAPDSRMLPSFPPSLHLLSPSSIYPLHLAACQIALCHRPLLQTLSIFVFLFSSTHHSIMCICLAFSILVCFVHPSYFVFPSEKQRLL